ncbi:N,N-dimethylformamidase beta subunit family domain-containing protein [Legionella sp. D16C41]|uniref:N,N-dimethylformamidase beta subunit family domain-containing protein n=1 Tax=Legionella sp. D16C41 TaxID=3402688 RepID=UPI003AF82698
MDFNRKLSIFRTSSFFLSALLFHSAFSSPVKMTPIQNPIVEENALPGTPGWDEQLWKKKEPLIEGYASTTSAAPGDNLEFHVRMLNLPGHYRLDIYRLGWYKGVGARKVACLPSCSVDKPGQFYPTGAMDLDTGELRNTWPVTDKLIVPNNWVSGYYFALPVLTDKKEVYEKPIPFIIKAAPDKKSTILVKASFNTWQAYNEWGGKSLYRSTAPKDKRQAYKERAYKVSFDRPLLIMSNGPFSREYNMVRFLEKNGYDVSYTTDYDIDQSPEDLKKYKLLISMTHDEYWSKQTRDAFESARDSGVNLAFMGANFIYWQDRYENNGRTLVVYREKNLDPEPNPSLKTIRYELLTPPRPECLLTGEKYNVGANGANRSDYVVLQSVDKDPWFKGTGFQLGEHITNVVGGEWNEYAPGCSQGTATVLFHSDAMSKYGTYSPADAIKLITPSGSKIFSAGSINFSVGLDNYGPYGKKINENEKLQRFMKNVLDDLSGKKS